ncbi:hypothetical protein D3C87_1759390 [compost metagenome]
MAVGVDPGDAVEEGGELGRDRRAAIGTGERADQCDAHLNGGKKLAGVFRQLQCRFGAEISLFCHLAKQWLACRDDCHFRESKKCVDQKQDENDKKFGHGLQVTVDEKSPNRERPFTR